MDFTRCALQREAKQQNRTPAPIDWAQGRHKELYEFMRGEMERIKTCPLCRCLLTAIRDRMSATNELVNGNRSTNFTLDRTVSANEGGTYAILSKLMAMCIGCNLVKSRDSSSEAKKRVALLKKNRNAATLDAEGFLIRPALAEPFEPTPIERHVLLARMKEMTELAEQHVEEYNQRPLSIKLGRVRRVNTIAEEALEVVLPFLIDAEHFLDITGRSTQR